MKITDAIKGIIGLIFFGIMIWFSVGFIAGIHSHVARRSPIKSNDLSSKDVVVRMEENEVVRYEIVTCNEFGMAYYSNGRYFQPVYKSPTEIATCDEIRELRKKK